MELKTIIGKEVLLEKLRENRERYVETRKTLIFVFIKKDKEYQKEYKKYSKKIYESTLAEDEERPYPPSIPADRTETYDMYIQMVERHCGDSLEIDSGNFNKLWMDKWDFIQQHIGAMTLWASEDLSLAAAVSDYGGQG